MQRPENSRRDTLCMEVLYTVCSVTGQLNMVTASAIVLVE